MPDSPALTAAEFEKARKQFAGGLQRRRIRPDRMMVIGRHGDRSVSDHRIKVVARRLIAHAARLGVPLSFDDVYGPTPQPSQAAMVGIAGQGV